MFGASVPTFCRLNATFSPGMRRTKRKPIESFTLGLLEEHFFTVTASRTLCLHYRLALVLFFALISFCCLSVIDGLTETHLLKREALRPQCRKRFTQCPLCNSCETPTELLLTPHAAPPLPLIKWNLRTTFGFCPITLEGDADWKQSYESRSVIMSVLLRSWGCGDAILCVQEKGKKNNNSNNNHGLTFLAL